MLAPAIDGSDLRAQVKEALIELGLTLIKLQDAETLNARLSKHSIDRDLRSLADEVELTGLLRFDIFQTFDLDSKVKRS